MAGHAFDQDDRAIELGGAQAAADRIALDLRFVAVEQRGELAGVRQEDGQRLRAACRRRAAPGCAAARRRARPMPSLCSSASASSPQARRFGHAGAARRPRPNSRPPRRCARTAARAKPPSRASSAGRATIASGMASEVPMRDAVDGGDAELARAGAHRGRGGEQRRAGHSRLPATIRIRPLVSLSPSTTGGSGNCLSADRVERLAGLHRVPVIMSGSAVLRRALGLQRRAVVPQRPAWGRRGPSASGSKS